MKPDNIRLNKAKKDASKDKTRSIGVLSEKILHSTLKNYFEEDIAYQEVKFGPYHADILRDNKIIEIQTKQFNKMREKLVYYISSPIEEVKIVYPMFSSKWLYWVDPITKEISNKRKSPKTLKINECFYELYKIKGLLKNKKIKIEILILDIEEYRYLNGYSENKKKGSSCMERRPIKIIDSIELNNISDYKAFIPNGLNDTFTIKEYSEKSNTLLRYASLAVNVLTSLNVLKIVGKRERSNLYQMNSDI